MQCTYIPNKLCAVVQQSELGMQVHRVGGQRLASALFVAVLITPFLLKTFSLLVYKRDERGQKMVKLGRNTSPGRCSWTSSIINCLNLTGFQFAASSSNASPTRLTHGHAIFAFFVPHLKVSTHSHRHWKSVNSPFWSGMFIKAQS